MNRLKFLKLCLVMPLVALAIVTACGKPKMITCGRFALTGKERVCNPAIIAWDFLKSNGLTVDDESFFDVAEQCNGLTGNNSYRKRGLSECEEILRMCKLGNFMVYVKPDGVFRAAKFLSEEEWQTTWAKWEKI